MVRLLFCLGVALLITLPPGLQAAPKAGQTKSDLAQVQDRIRNLEKQTKQDLARRADLDCELRKAETAAGRIRSQLNATRRELAAVEADK